jgi:glycosyltransferase involved in cell wall biosynthesis
MFDRLRHMAQATISHGGLFGLARIVRRGVRERGPGFLAFLLGSLRNGGRLARNNYSKWIKHYDTLDDDRRRRMVEQCDRWENPPLVSILLPVYDPPLDYLKQAIASVRGQLYPHWELCVADDGSSDPRISELLTLYASEDPRIQIRWREKNGGIAAASNTALAMARGSWVALLDHDDRLAEHALYELVATVRRHPEVRMVYSDEDKINTDGYRYGPYFKPNWNLALFRSHNLVTHLAAYRKDLLEETGGFREGFEGAQDYDLALRCAERLEPRQIRHIPWVLYHWRSHAGSTADPSADAKPHAMNNGRRALQEHLDRCGITGEVELIAHGFRVHYALPEPPPLASLIIPTKDRVHLIKRCVESLLEKTDYPDFEIIIVDNGSTDPAACAFLETVATRPSVRVLHNDGPFNFARLNNEAVRAAQGSIVGLLNSDLEAIDPGWLREMASLAVQSDIGAVGALLLYPDRRVQHGGIVLGISRWAGHAHKNFPEKSLGYAGRLALVSEFTAVTAACLLIRKSLFEQLGGLDEENLPVACNDVDLCLRLQEAGYRNVWTPFAKFIHHESASRGYEDTPEKAARFSAELAVMRERWGEKLQHDRYYNPNLTLESEDFSLSWPPRVGDAANESPVDASMR